MPEKNPLPKFSNPPVVETVIGIQFKPLESWSVLHYGIFWSLIAKEYPNYNIQDPLLPAIESFEPVQPQQMSVFLEPQDVRCWFHSADGNSLIQLQKNKLIFNWKKATATDVYPHYEESIRPSFTRTLDMFRNFISQNNLGELEIDQAEITYVNHIDKGSGWQNVRDWQNVFPFWKSTFSGNFLPQPERINFELGFLLPQKTGRLRVNVKPAIRKVDGQEIIQLNIMARGRPKASDNTSLLEWFDLGREWIVRGFVDLTSNQMHGIWGLQQ